MQEVILNAIHSITADYSDSESGVAKDARQFADEYGLSMDELSVVIAELDADYTNGDLTGPVVVIEQREADGTPWVLTVYPDGETFNALK